MYTTTKAVDGVIGIPYITSTPHPLRVLTLLPHPLASRVSSTVAYLSYMPNSVFWPLPYAVTVNAAFAPLGRKVYPVTCSLPLRQLAPVYPSHWLSFYIACLEVQ